MDALCYERSCSEQASSSPLHGVKVKENKILTRNSRNKNPLVRCDYLLEEKKSQTREAVLKKRRSIVFQLRNGCQKSEKKAHGYGTKREEPWLFRLWRPGHLPRRTTLQFENHHGFR